MNSKVIARMERIVRQWKQAVKESEKANRRAAEMERVYRMVCNITRTAQLPAIESPLDDGYRQAGE
jgi:hypothetical protein